MVYRATPKMQERKDARRRRILAAATRLFGAHGYHATTVPMIVTAASTSTGNFYFYFRNKEDGFADALSDLGERISGAIDAAIAAVPPAPLCQMKAAVEGFVLFLAAHPEEARILIVESSGLNRDLEQIRRSIIASHTRGVEQGLRLLAPRGTGAPRRGPLYRAIRHVGAASGAVWPAVSGHHEREARGGVQFVRYAARCIGPIGTRGGPRVKNGPPHRARRGAAGAGYWRNWASRASIASCGMYPTRRAASRPSLNRIRVGMLKML